MLTAATSRNCTVESTGLGRLKAGRQGFDPKASHAMQQSVDVPGVLTALLVGAELPESRLRFEKT